MAKESTPPAGTKPEPERRESTHFKGQTIAIDLACNSLSLTVYNNREGFLIMEDNNEAKPIICHVPWVCDPELSGRL
jgi:hypothetical protein